MSVSRRTRTANLARALTWAALLLAALVRSPGSHAANGRLRDGNPTASACLDARACDPPPLVAERGP